MIKSPPAVQETWVRSLGWEDPLEKEMPTHSSILAWRIPWTEEPGGLQSMESQSWTQLSDFTFTNKKFKIWKKKHKCRPQKKQSLVPDVWSLLAVYSQLPTFLHQQRSTEVIKSITLPAVLPFRMAYYSLRLSRFFPFCKIQSFL